MKIVFKEEIKINDRLRAIKKFVIIPRIINGTLVWLETAYLLQRYSPWNDFFEWKTIRLLNYFEFLEYKEKANRSSI